MAGKKAEKLIRYKNITNIDQIIYSRGRRHRLNARTGTIVLPESEGRKFVQILKPIGPAEDQSED